MPTCEISIPIDDFGFAMGVTVVERLRTFGGKLFRADKHLQRMRRSLEIVGWDADALCDELAAALSAFVERNQPLIAGGDDWSVAAFVTPGSSPTAEKPTVCVHGNPLPFHSWADQFDVGLDAVIAGIRELPANVWPPELKCRSRMHYYLADQQARQKQPGARAILLDQDGMVCQGSTANVVAYFDERGLVTPRRTKVLPGVTQEVLYEVAESLGIESTEADMTPEEFAAADEIYFVSTSICLLPVVQLDGTPIGHGQPGPIYRKLLAAWSEQIGIDIAQQAKQFCDRKK
ncbi:MAG: aminotransferase class IV [Planctomycetota bacterium]